MHVDHAFLSIISCGISKQHPTHIGLCLFTFTKLRIRDNAQHCRVPEIRPDGLDDVHLHTFLLFERIQNFGRRYFYWCVYRLLQIHCWTRCSPLHSLSTVSRTRSSTTSPASFKNRCGSIWLEFIITPVDIRLLNVVSISRHRSPWHP